MDVIDNPNFIPPTESLVYGEEWYHGEESHQAVSAGPQFLPRPRVAWIAFLLPLAICGISYMSGGMPMFTDLGFLCLTLLCALMLALEIKAFPQRLGLGGLVLFGGVLGWFCYDYMYNFFGQDHHALPIGDVAELLGRQSFIYCIFVLFLVIGLGLPPWPGFERKLASIPEPSTASTYFIVWALMTCMGFSAFLFSADSLPVTLYKAAFSPWLHQSVQFTVGRTGNYNTNWGGYIAQFIDVGVMGSIIGVMYAIFIARDVFTRILCWVVWGFWVLFLYSDGRRGHIAGVAMPAVAFLYLRYQFRVLEYGKKHSILGYIVVGILGLGLALVIQIQGKFRDTGLGDVDLSKTDITKLEGNYMFSEAMPGFRVVPDRVPFFCNSVPGEGFIRPIPDTLFWFVVGPIPRAAWPSKPSDPAMVWYNQLVAGTDGREGTTISQGLVGHWYFRYGIGGVIEGGLLIGWLMGVCERLLQSANGRPMTILASLAMATWLFRIYRNFYFIELYGPIIGILVFILFTKLLGSSSNAAPAPASLEFGQAP
jgi:hypothetical protein